MRWKAHVEWDGEPPSTYARSVGCLRSRPPAAYSLKTSSPGCCSRKIGFAPGCTAFLLHDSSVLLDGSRAVETSSSTQSLIFVKEALLYIEPIARSVPANSSTSSSQMPPTRLSSERKVPVHRLHVSHKGMLSTRHSTGNDLSY